MLITVSGADGKGKASVVYKYQMNLLKSLLVSILIMHKCT